MDDVTLKLATVDQLIEELKARCESVIIGYTAQQENHFVFRLFREGRPMECLGLASAMRREVENDVADQPEIG